MRILVGGNIFNAESLEKLDTEVWHKVTVQRALGFLIRKDG